MKLSDRISSLMFFLGAVILWFAADKLPNPGQQLYGPGFYPKALALFIGVAAVLQFIKSVKSENGQPFAKGCAWIRDRQAVISFLIVNAAVVFYYFFIEKMGFIEATAVFLFILFKGLGVRLGKTIGLTIGVTLLVYVLFDLLLRVPLPRGPLALW